jgi:F0F1-type ATP synthase delta subunit
MDLIQHLRKLKDSVPIIHMTFATQADRDSLQQLAQWLRTEVHPQAVIGVGLQPALVAGVYVRTPNHIHDLTIRGKLESSRGVLVQELEALSGAK